MDRHRQTPPEMPEKLLRFVAAEWSDAEVEADRDRRVRAHAASHGIPYVAPTPEMWPSMFDGSDGRYAVWLHARTEWAQANGVSVADVIADAHRQRLERLRREVGPILGDPL
jgi:hypothetical protein